MDGGRVDRPGGPDRDKVGGGGARSSRAGPGRAAVGRHRHGRGTRRGAREASLSRDAVRGDRPGDPGMEPGTRRRPCRGAGVARPAAWRGGGCRHRPAAGASRGTSVHLVQTPHRRRVGGGNRTLRGVPRSRRFLGGGGRRGLRRGFVRLVAGTGRLGASGARRSGAAGRDDDRFAAGPAPAGGPARGRTERSAGLFGLDPAGDRVGKGRAGRGSGGGCGGGGRRGWGLERVSSRRCCFVFFRECRACSWTGLILRSCANNHRGFAKRPDLAAGGAAARG